MCHFSACMRADQSMRKLSRMCDSSLQTGFRDDVSRWTSNPTDCTYNQVERLTGGERTSQARVVATRSGAVAQFRLAWRAIQLVRVQWAKGYNFVRQEPRRLSATPSEVANEVWRMLARRDLARCHRERGGFSHCPMKGANVARRASSLYRP